MKFSLPILSSSVFWSVIMFFSLVLIWFLPWRFQVNDDEMMMWLVSGAYTGNQESYSVFLNPLLSRLFSGLYKLWPNMTWYPLAWFSILFFSFDTLNRIAISKAASAQHQLIWILILFSFVVHSAFFLQFSVVSALAVTAGLSSRIWKFFKGYRSFGDLKKEDILLFFGFLIREEVAYLLLAGFFGFGFLFGNRKIVFKACLLPLLLFLAGSSLTNIWIDFGDFQEFKRHNKLRSEVFDHPMLQLEKEVWKEKDPSLFHFGNGLQDFQRDNLDPERLEAWKVKLDSSRPQLISPSFFRKALLTYIEKEHFFILLWVGLFLYLLSLRSWRLASLFVVVIGGMIILAPFFLLKVQIHSLGFLLLIGIVLLFQKENPPHSSRFHFGLGVLLIFGLLFHWFSFFKAKGNIPDSSQLQKQLSLLKEEGVEEIFFISENKFYRDFVFEKPLPFRIMGWSSLLLSYHEKSESEKVAYLVHENTFRSNRTYFENKGHSFYEFEEFVLVKTNGN
ncbi:MAG: hypothetical protein EP311_08385 [Cytophagales bacterium]|nr:MAG: hypothetical protein EP311_08385 [Cytophagales bacterium]